MGIPSRVEGNDGGVRTESIPCVQEIKRAWKMPVIQPALHRRRAPVATPRNKRCDRTVHIVTVFQQQACICFIESPAAKRMATRHDSKPFFEKIGHGAGFFLHERLWVFDEIGMIMKVVVSQRLQW